MKFDLHYCYETILYSRISDRRKRDCFRDATIYDFAWADASGSQNSAVVVLGCDMFSLMLKMKRYI